MELLETTIANSLFASQIQTESLLGRDLVSPQDSLSDGEEIVNDNINGFI
jgi:hypothetical protein